MKKATFRFYHSTLIIALSVVLLSSCTKETTSTNNGTFYQSGTNGIVGATAVYNGNLVAGGNFTDIDSIQATDIVQWNGTKWVALGTGITQSAPLGTCEINAMTTFNGNLIVGGYFSYAGSNLVNGIAQWNGSAWTGLASGVTAGIGQINAMLVWNGNLIVAGSFTSAGTTNANNIAVWNGTSWSAIGHGIHGSVAAMALYNNNLIIGGSFDSAGGILANNIVQYDGSNWTAFANGIKGTINVFDPILYPVNTIAVYNNNLVIGGNFDSGAGQPSYIAQWNGVSWQRVGTGIRVGDPTSLIVWNGTLVASFGTSGIASSNGLYQWNGLTWSSTAMGGTFQSNTLVYWTQNYDPNLYSINSLSLYNGNLIVGGNFYNAGGLATNSIVSWNGSSWSKL